MAKVKVNKSSNVQLENGYIKIANELYDAILDRHFKSREYQVLLTVLRFTYGFNRKDTELATRFIADRVGLHHGHAAVIIKDLILKRVLVEKKAASRYRGRIIGINKSYEEWEVTKVIVKGRTDMGAMGRRGRRGGSTNLVQDTYTDSVPRGLPKEYNDGYRFGTTMATKNDPPCATDSVAKITNKDKDNKDKDNNNKYRKNIHPFAPPIDSSTKDDIVLLDAKYYKWCISVFKYCPSDITLRESIFEDLLKRHSFSYLDRRLDQFFVTTYKWVLGTDRGAGVFRRFVDQHLGEKQLIAAAPPPHLREDGTPMSSNEQLVAKAIAEGRIKPRSSTGRAGIVTDSVHNI